MFTAMQKGILHMTQTEELMGFEALPDDPLASLKWYVQRATKMVEGDKDSFSSDEELLIAFLAMVHTLKMFEERPVYQEGPALLEALELALELTHDITQPDGMPDRDVEMVNKMGREVIKKARGEKP